MTQHPMWCKKQQNKMKLLVLLIPGVVAGATADLDLAVPAWDTPFNGKETCVDASDSVHTANKRSVYHAVPDGPP